MNSICTRFAKVVALTCGLILTATTGWTQESDGFQTQGGKKKHRKRQERPIQLGTSGSNAEDIAGGYCCNGTLGALVEKNGIQYVLSNNHVLGRSNNGKKGEAIIQPGYSDQSCPARNEAMDTVAHLTAKKRIRFGSDRSNKADVAIAEVVPGAVRPDGEILKIGVPGTTPAAPFIGMQVKKAGRTTGLTRGVVTAIDVSVIIEDFPLDCSEAETTSAVFNKQIIISGNDGKRFLDSGDSGSMAYRDEEHCPAPVGLLFAGGGNLAAAAPASTVLKTVRKLKPRGGTASFVGCQSAGMEIASRTTPILRPTRVREASDALQESRQSLLDAHGVQAVGVGMTLSGPIEPAIYVFATESRDEMLGRLPERVGDFAVEVIETDRLVAYCGQRESG